MDRAEHRVRRVRRAVTASRWRRRLGAWLGLAALAPHLLLALMVSMAQAAPGSAGKEWALVNCVVYAEGTGKPGTDTDRRKGDTRTDCPVCQTETLCKNLLPVAAVVMPLPTPAMLSRPAGPAHDVAIGNDSTRRLARGPPSAA